METSEQRRARYLVQRETKEGKLKECWYNMLARCFNSKSPGFKHYGGRGIQVCAQWSHSFEAFWRDMEVTWSRGLTIDRINNEGHYNRENCKWSTRSEQGKNKRKYVILEPGSFQPFNVSLTKHLTSLNNKLMPAASHHYVNAAELARALGLSPYMLKALQVRGKIPGPSGFMCGKEIYDRDKVPAIRDALAKQEVTECQT